MYTHTHTHTHTHAHAHRDKCTLIHTLTHMYTHKQKRTQSNRSAVWRKSIGVKDSHVSWALPLYGVAALADSVSNGRSVECGVSSGQERHVKQRPSGAVWPSW